MYDELFGHARGSTYCSFEMTHFYSDASDMVDIYLLVWFNIYLLTTINKLKMKKI